MAGVTVRAGDRVEWDRCGAPFGGRVAGYVSKIIPDDGRGSIRIRVRSNARSYVLLPSEILIIQRRGAVRRTGPHDVANCGLRRTPALRMAAINSQRAYPDNKCLATVKIAADKVHLLQRNG